MFILCGRFSLVEDIHHLQEAFDFEMSDEITPRYNIAPGQKIIAIVSNENKRIGKWMKWGLVPYWSKEPKIGYKMINARSEGIDTKPAFKAPFKRRRTLIPASGFYEWENTVDGKQPYRLILNKN